MLSHSVQNDREIMTRVKNKENIENQEVLDSQEAVEEPKKKPHHGTKGKKHGHSAGAGSEKLAGSSEKTQEEVEKLRSELEEMKEKYLRLYSEFDNFRKRTAREKLEMVKTANEKLLIELLPILDDFERAQKAIEESDDHRASKEGFELIYNKFFNILQKSGLKAMEIEPGSEFDTEFHEAISQMPVEDESMKGKIIDVVEKGYLLDDKVIRYAKVVIGA